MLEYIGVITGFICVWLTAKQSLLNFPISIISIIIYTYIFYEARLYADMLLQVYFMGMTLYGWYFWINRNNGDEKVIPVRRIDKLHIIIGILITIVFTSGFGWFLSVKTDADLPYLDSFCTACSLVASFYSSRRILENYIVWIFVDCVYIYLYIVKKLHPTAILYAVFVGVAVYGYLEWKKNWKEHQLKLAS
ncbi:nicotinamide riboside transporter PnuC [Membranihabitans marinus]|uniref:nicotinamide riboside transporter PnuC n=1 Tax=Membranihabitans marinus TaxID=1227546 RepID=UPI001F022C08|nr:nicotinamide riboside transporter PnuC [Membranihabitans marinus]